MNNKKIKELEKNMIINEKEEKLKTYEEVYEENIIKLEKLKDSDTIKCDNDFFIWQSKNYKDPDGYIIRYDNLYNIPCTCDGLISIRRMSYFVPHTNYVGSILDEYKTLRKYPIIYFPSEEGGINQSRADYKKFGDLIDYTLFDIKNFYQVLKKYKEKNKYINYWEFLNFYNNLPKEEKLVLMDAYKLSNTFKFLTTFKSFEEFIDWEFNNHDDLIRIFIDISDKNNYQVYDIETGNIITSYKKKYTWTNGYYNNLKEKILKYNAIKEMRNKNG